MNVTRAVKVVLMLTMILNTNVVYGEFQNYREAVQAAIDDTNAQNYDDARANLKEALALAANDNQRASSQTLWAQIDAAEKKYAQAHERLASVLRLAEISPSSRLSALSAIGQTFQAEGKYVDARSAYDQALKLEGVSPSSLFPVQLQKAQSFSAEKKYPEAREEFGKLLAYRDEIPFVHVMTNVLVGKAFLQEGLIEKAREEFLKALAWKEDEAKQEPDDDAWRAAYSSTIFMYKQMGQLNVADTYLREKNYAQAATEINSLLAMQNLNPQVKAQAEKLLQVIAEQEKAR